MERCVHVTIFYVFFSIAVVGGLFFWYVALSVMSSEVRLVVIVQ